MQWLTQTLVASLYPGAPYERKYLAVLLLGTLLEVWNSPDAGCKSFISLQGGEGSLPASNEGLLVVGQHSFKAFCDGFFEAKPTRLLLGEHHCISACALCGGVRCELPEGEGSLPASNQGLLLVGHHSFKAFCDGFFGAKTTQLLLSEHHHVMLDMSGLSGLYRGLKSLCPDT